MEQKKRKGNGKKVGKKGNKGNWTKEAKGGREGKGGSPTHISGYTTDATLLSDGLGLRSTAGVVLSNEGSVLAELAEVDLVRVYNEARVFVVAG